MGLVVLLVLHPEITKDARSQLMGCFRGCHVEQLQSSNLASFFDWSTKGFCARTSLAVRIADRAGGIPWVLDSLVGTERQTLFVGLDLGHNHFSASSTIDLVCVDPSGRILEHKSIGPLRMNERVRAATILKDLPHILRNYSGEYQQVIIHRDGRMMEMEKDDLMKLVSRARASIVGVRKNCCTRLAGEDSSNHALIMSRQRALCVTNRQNAKRAMPTTLEVVLEEPGGLDIESAVRQVFWLSRAYCGSVFQPKRLPITTWKANNIASTGQRVFVRSMTDEK